MVRKLKKPQRCSECGKLIGQRRKNESGLCEYHYKHSKEVLDYKKKHRQEPEVKKRVNENQRRYSKNKRESLKK